MQLQQMGLDGGLWPVPLCAASLCGKLGLPYSMESQSSSF